MSDTDILKQKSLNTGQIIGLVLACISATFAVTKIVLDIEYTKARVEQVNERIDKKHKQAVEKIEAITPKDD
jgi:hypothetical protein